MQAYRYTEERTKEIYRRPTLVAHITPANSKKKALAKPDTYGRNFGLDLLRCSAILLVLLDHGSYLYYNHISGLIGNNISLTGHWGVQMFFVLSGFLIGRILIREIMYKPFNLKAIFNFWTRRWFRTVPNYFLFIALSVIIYFAIPAPFLKTSHWHGVFTVPGIKHFAWYPFFLQNFLSTDLSFMGHTWSLAVEEWFYLILPAVLFPIVFFHRRGALKKKLLICFTGLAAFFIVLRIAGIMQIWPGYTKLSVIYNLDHLMIGVIVGWLFTFYKANMLSKKNHLLIISAILFVAGFFLQNIFMLTGHPDSAWDALIIPLQTIAFACALPWFYAINLKRKTWICRLITRISIASYSVYLVHFMILVLVIDTIQTRFHIASAFGALALFLLYIFITIRVSSLNYRFFEKRMTALREQVSHS